MLKWIDNLVDEYCQKKFVEASKAVDKKMANLTEFCESSLDSHKERCLIEGETKLSEVRAFFLEDVEKVKSEFKKSLENSDLRAELTKCFKDYVEENFVRTNPILVSNSDDSMSYYSETYDLELITMASFESQGSMSIANGSMRDAKRLSVVSAVMSASKLALLAGGELGAEIAHVVTENSRHKTWTDKDYKQTASSETVINVAFYRIIKNNSPRSEDADPAVDALLDPVLLAPEVIGGQYDLEESIIQSHLEFAGESDSSASTESDSSEES